jgi:hypothetical protein
VRRPDRDTTWLLTFLCFAVGLLALALIVHDVNQVNWGGAPPWLNLITTAAALGLSLFVLFRQRREASERDREARAHEESEAARAFSWWTISPMWQLRWPELVLEFYTSIADGPFFPDHHEPDFPASVLVLRNAGTNPVYNLTVFGIEGPRRFVPAVEPGTTVGYRFIYTMNVGSTAERSLDRIESGAIFEYIEFADSRGQVWYLAPGGALTKAPAGTHSTPRGTV